MSKPNSLLCGCLAAAASCLFHVACEPQGQRAPAPALPVTRPEAVLTVHVDRPGIQTSPMLWGLFFEEINRAGDGGLYAERVQNRSFEDAEQPSAWSLLKGEGSEAVMALDKGRPLNEKNPTSLRLEIKQVGPSAGSGAGPSTGSGQAGVANEGLKGIAIKKGGEYVLSLYARASDDIKGPLTAGLESRDGKTVYASARIEGIGADWRKFTAALQATAADPAARLTIRAASAGTVWLDMVSLFPKDTWKGRPNGLRADLAGMLADLKPSFVRFPGGCFVEGDKLKEAFRWKDTIGDVAARPGHWNLWGYRSTDGLGYHEYLQMCEDLGAEPLFVVNCGMAHKDVAPTGEMGPWVQDALDAIEYANGPPDSTWGSLRAKAGHPAPFNLQYMEIGNENGGPPYQERYGLFVDAIKAKYPAMHLVANEWGGTPKGKPIEIVDEHYYSGAEFFLSQARKYDAYKRDGPKVYVGEYAVTQGCGQGNLRAALGEAAFMMVMERNSDLVVMASYAPLFVNVGWRQWNPDAIQFDAARACGTPSYWAQQMFGCHRGDRVLPAEIDLPPMPAETRHGGVGLGTWATQAEYKDIRVTQGDKVLLAADFAKGAEGWKTLHGQWTVQDGAYQQTSADTDCRATTGDASWADTTYSLKARKLGGAEGFLIMFQVRDEGNWLWWNLGGWGNKRHAIEKCEGGGKSALGPSVDGSIETGRWYDVRIELEGPRIRCFLDGQLVEDVTDSAGAPVHVSATTSTATGEVILKVVNAADRAWDVQVNLAGATKVAASGTALVLTSADPKDENTLAEPKKVAPATRSVGGLGPSFRYTFPAHSLTILRAKAAP